MNDNWLTQQEIDGGQVSLEDTARKTGLAAKAASHPFLAGGAILVGAGLAYATAKVISKTIEGKGVASDIHVETSIAIDKSPEELYSFWRDFKNLPLFMNNLESVSTLDGGQTHWVARGIGGARVEWDAEIYNEIENELIAWRSLENADIVNAGSVRFQAAPTGHGTYVRIAMNYNLPTGTVGATLAQLLGTEPSQLIKEDLRRLKQMLEAGEIATIEGQSSGRRAEAMSDPGTEAPPIEIPAEIGEGSQSNTFHKQQGGQL